MLRDKIRKAKGYLHLNMVRDMKNDRNGLGFVVVLQVWGRGVDDEGDRIIEWLGLEGTSKVT